MIRIAATKVRRLCMGANCRMIRQTIHTDGGLRGAAPQRAIVANPSRMEGGPRLLSSSRGTAQGSSDVPTTRVSCRTLSPCMTKRTLQYRASFATALFTAVPTSLALTSRSSKLSALHPLPLTLALCQAILPPFMRDDLERPPRDVALAAMPPLVTPALAPAAPPLLPSGMPVRPELEPEDWDLPLGPAGAARHAGLRAPPPAPPMTPPPNNGWEPAAELSPIASRPHWAG